MLKILISDTIQIFQLILLFYFTFRMIRDGLVRRSLTAIFYVFGNAAYFVLDVYWIVHLILKEGETPNFSAVEIGMVGVCLLYGTALACYGGQKHVIDWKSLPVLVAILFSAANTACWIGWNGGWFRDTITGLAMGYMACVLASLAGGYDRYDRKKFAIALPGCIVLMGLEAGTLMVTGAMVPVLEVLRYILWFGGIVHFSVGIYQYVFREKNTDYGLFSSFAGFLFSAFAMYLSANTMYQIMAVITTAMLIPMYLSVRREAEQE